MTLSTAENLAALEEALSTGARKIKYEDREVELDIRSMLALRAKMRRDLGLDPAKPRRTVSQHSKGLR